MCAFGGWRSRVSARRGWVERRILRFKTWIYNSYSRLTGQPKAESLDYFTLLSTVKRKWNEQRDTTRWRRVLCFCSKLCCNYRPTHVVQKQGQLLHTSPYNSKNALSLWLFIVCNTIYIVMYFTVRFKKLTFNYRKYMLRRSYMGSKWLEAVTVVCGYVNSTQLHTCLPVGLHVIQKRIKCSITFSPLQTTKLTTRGEPCPDQLRVPPSLLSSEYRGLFPWR
jgi:hypothetical protein